MTRQLYPFMTSVDGPHSRPEYFREEKNLLLLPGFERRSVQPVAIVAVTYTAVRTTKLWRCDCSNRGIVKVWAFMRCLMETINSLKCMKDTWEQTEERRRAVLGYVFLESN